MFGRTEEIKLKKLESDMFSTLRYCLGHSLYSYSISSHFVWVTVVNLFQRRFCLNNITTCQIVLYRQHYHHIICHTSHLFQKSIIGPTFISLPERQQASPVAELFARPSESLTILFAVPVRRFGLR